MTRREGDGQRDPAATSALAEAPDDAGAVVPALGGCATATPSVPPGTPSRVESRQRLTVRRFAGHVDHERDLGHTLRVAHLTDLHVGLVTPMALQTAAARLTNEYQPDLVAITGDFVCHSHAYLDALAELIGMLQAPTICVLGNHDYWSGADEVVRTLRRAGAEVLRNQNTTLTLHGERLQLVGLDDTYTGHGSVERAVKGLDPKIPKLGLSHIPEEADALWAHGVSLVLSGHTHAGQITIARLHELALGKLAGHRYVHGLYGCRRGLQKGAVYVGAGIGAAIMPLRIGERAKPELALFELGQGPGSFDEHHSEQQPLAGRKPSAKKQYRRAATVVKKELRRKKKAAKREAEGT